MHKIFGSFDNFDNYDYLNDVSEELEDTPEYSGFRSLMNFWKDPDVGVINKIAAVFLFAASVFIITALTLVIIPMSVIFWLISGIYTIGEEIFGGLCGKS